MTIVTPNDLQFVMGSTVKTRPLNQPGGGTLVALATQASAYSEDGLTWTKSDLPDLSPNVWAVMANNGKTVVAMNIAFTVYVSSDSGKTFTKTTDDATNGNGGSWSVSPRQYTKQLIYASYLGAFIFTNNAGFGISTDNGATWSFELWTTNHSAAFNNFYYLEPSDSLGIIVGGGSDSAHMIWTEDGSNWTRVSSSSPSSSPQFTYQIWCEKLSAFYSTASIWSFNATKAQKSTDGKTWSNIASVDGVYLGSYHSAAFSPTLGSNNGRMIFTRGVSYNYSDDNWTTPVDASFLGGGGGAKFDIIWSPVFKNFYTIAGNTALRSASGLTLTWTADTILATFSGRQMLEVG